MKKVIFLNCGKIDFDNQLDYSSLMSAAKITTYPESNSDEILERIQGHNIVITKELPLSRDLIEGSLLPWS